MRLLPRLQRVLPRPVVIVIWALYCGLGSFWLGFIRHLVYIVGGGAAGVAFLVAGIAYVVESPTASKFFGLGWKAFGLAILVGIVGDLVFSDEGLRGIREKRVAQRL